MSMVKIGVTKKDETLTKEVSVQAIWVEKGGRKATGGEHSAWGQDFIIPSKLLFGHNFARWLYGTCQKNSALRAPADNNKVHSDAK